MTDKKKWWAGLGAALIPIAAVAALWPNFEPVFDWFLKISLLILDKPVVQAVIVSMAIGVLLSGVLPHISPAKWQASTTKAVTRSVCMVVTFASCYVLERPTTSQEQASALVYALLSALAAAQVWTTASGLLYKVASRPESLK